MPGIILAVSRDYFSCLRKRTKSFPKLTLWRSREFLRVHGPVSRGFESWSEGVTWIVTANSLLGRGRAILKDKEVLKPPEGVLFCLLSHSNCQSSEWDCLSMLSKQEQKVKKFTQLSTEAHPIHKKARPILSVTKFLIQFHEFSQ